MAEKCQHHDRKLYARGVCKACYLRDYHNRLRAMPYPEEEEMVEENEVKIPKSP